MEISYIKAKNFLSFKEVNYTINNGVPTLLVGENKTDENQESNGSGKSALSIIIEYALLHTTSKKVNDKDLVMWGQPEDASIELSINCPIRNETVLIERVISIKNGGKSQLSVNGVIRHSFEDKMVSDIDKFIIDWIGISKEDLQNFFLLSKFKYTSFFAASNTQLIQLIGRFSNTVLIDGIDKDILKEVGLYEQEKELVISKKNRLYGQIEVHNDNIQKELTVDKNQLVVDRLAEIDGKVIAKGEEVIHLWTQIGVENDRIGTYEDLLISKITDLQNANRQLQALNAAESFENRYHDVDIKLNDVKQGKENVEQQLNKLHKDTNETKLILQDINRNILGAVTCPKCKHQFLVADEGVDIEEEKIASQQTTALINQLTNMINELNKSIQEYEPKIRDLKRDRSVIEAEENELRNQKRILSNSVSTIETQKHQIETSIQICNNKVKSYKEQIIEVEKAAELLTLSKSKVTIDSFDNTERLAAIKQSIVACEQMIEECEAEGKLIEDKIFHIKQWSFTFKEFVQYLSTKTLKVLEGYANHFLLSIKSDLRVQLDGYKLKADGTLSDKITAYVIRNGEKREFNSFSGGERVRLECSMILTIQHAINSTHKFGGLNFCSIDEIFESSDSIGIRTLTTSLMELGKTLLITTHIPGSNYDCPVLTITKINGISSIS